MDFRKYFEQLQSIANAEMAELRKLDRMHNLMHSNYYDNLKHGKLTPFGYDSLTKGLDDAMDAAKKKATQKIAALQREYDSAIDKATSITSTAIDSGDVEMLKLIPITSTDFDQLVEKHFNNPTMLRILDKYKKEHDIQTTWRYQTPEQRKEIFNNVCWAIEGIVKGSVETAKVHTGCESTFMRSRELRIERLINGAYHKLQGSDPNALPVPPAESDDEDKPLSERYNLM